MDFLFATVRDPEQRKTMRLLLWFDRACWFTIGVLSLIVAQGIALVIYG
jgi:hypothetical protein